jgi:hypothetical protein
MVKYETNTSSGTSFRVPYCKKGYYPAQLISVEEFKKHGEPVVRQGVGYSSKNLILKFQVYKPGENDEPKEALMWTDASTNIEQPVVMTIFRSYQVKNADDDEWRSAFTPKSSTTRTFEALGWKFNANPIDTDEFIGNWCELNIEDYEVKKEGVDTYKASQVAKEGVKLYTGPKPAIGLVKEKDVVPSTKEVEDVMDEIEVTDVV